MSIWRRIGIGLGACALALAGSTAGLHHVSAEAGVVGHVYVNDNTAGINTVAAFDRHSDGTLTPMPGSPFTVGGAGTGSSIGAQGALQLSADGRFLLAADAGSNAISVLRIGPFGGLHRVPGGLVYSGGNEPVSIAVHGPLVYVANTGTGGTNYSGFILTAWGQLRPLPGSTVTLPDGSGLGDVLFNAAGTNLVGTRVTTSLIDSFVVGRDGHLTAAPGSPFTDPVAGPFGSGFRPTNSAQLFVTNAHAGTGNGSVSAYVVATDGTLSAIGAPVPDHQTAPCWLAITPDGRYLFASNTASNTISSYTIAQDGTPTLNGSTPLSGAAGTGPFDLELDPGARDLYVVDASGDAVSAFAVSGGTLTELPGSPVALPAGATPFGIAIN